MKKIIYTLLAIVGVLVTILLFNTLSLSSKQVASEAIQKIAISNGVYSNLSKAIQSQTISYSEDAIPDSTAFYGFHRYLAETLALVHENLILEKISEYRLMYTWKGAD